MNMGKEVVCKFCKRKWYLNHIPGKPATKDKEEVPPCYGWFPKCRCASEKGLEWEDTMLIRSIKVSEGK